MALLVFDPGGSWDQCPHCRSTEIKGAALDMSRYEIVHDIVCQNCGEAWQEVYFASCRRKLIPTSPTDQHRIVGGLCD